MATLIFLFSIVSNPGTPALDEAVDTRNAPQEDMRYYGVEQLLAKFETEA